MRLEGKHAPDRWGRVLRESLGRYRLVWLAILAGLVLLLLPSGRDRETPAAQQETAAVFDLSETEQRLGETLSRIDGAGEVTVLLSLRDGPKRVLAQNRQEGGERTETVVLSRGGGSQETVTVQELSPGYQGALLICEGGDDPRVRLALTQAVSALTGLGADKISISKGK